MTIASIANKKQYDGNDVTTDFVFPYKFILDSHLVVVLTDVNDADTTLVLDTDYTVSGAGDEGGGTVTYPVSGDPLAIGKVLTIYRDVAYTQGTDLSNQGAFFLENLEDALDYLTMITQQVQEVIDRCVKTTVTDPDDPPTLANFNAMIDAGIAGWALVIAALTQIASVAYDDKIPIWDLDQDAIHYATPIQLIGGFKGADIASATALVLGADGNYFAVTGSTTIQSIGTVKIGFEVTLHFNKKLTLAHHVTNLILPSGNHIETKAGDVLIFREYDIGRWELIAANRPIDAKNADIASATALPVLAPGYADVTGTATITSINSIGVGTEIKLHFDEILTLTHHATNLVLLGGANITTAAGDEAKFIEYAAGDWRCVNYSRSSGLAVQEKAIRDVSRGLIVKNNAGNPNYQIDIDADEIILQDANGEAARITNVNITLDITSDLDTGSEANSTIYYLWVTSAGAGKLSLSSTAPTIPASTKKALVGAVINNGSGHFISIYQRGNRVRCNSGNTSGLASTSAASVDISPFVPITAILLYGGLRNNAADNRMQLNPVTFTAGQGNSFTEVAATTTNGDEQFLVPIETPQTIYYAVGAGTMVITYWGWEY